MKKRLFFITCLMMLCSLTFGQDSHWTVNANYEYNMNAFITFKVYGEKQMRTDMELAAFHDGKVCGVDTEGQIININGEDHIVYYITIQGNKASNVFNFRLYDPVADKELVTDETFKFRKDVTLGMTGTEITPLEFDFYYVYWNYNTNYEYTENMTVTSKVQIDGVEQSRLNLEVAAFHKNENGTEELLAVSRTKLVNGAYIVTLLIRGDSWAWAEYEDESKITFKLYDHSNDEILETEYYEIFEDGKIVSGPIVINFTNPYVAKIGDVKYSTLEGGVEAYKQDETIVMLKNAQSETAVTINTDVTIDFAGFTYDGALVLNKTLNVVRKDETKAGTATSIVLNDGAQINHSYALATTIVRNVAGTASGWGTLSAPTAEGKVAFNTTGQHDFYQYVEEGIETAEGLLYEWDYIEVTGNAYQMTPGRGYLYANAADVTMSFAGTLNMNKVNFPLSYTAGKEDLQGFNMIGNPYTHNISLAHLSGSIANAFYSVATNGAWLANADAPENIAPFQAFLVQTSETGAVDGLIINKTATETRSASEGRLKINVANNSYNDVAYVLFEEGIGLRKIGHFNEEIPMVSVSVEGKEYAAATMSKDVTEIPVSFKAMTMGQYTISVEAQDCEFDALYLTDKLTGEKVNLNIESYTFMATSNDNPNRFVLTTRGTTDIEQNEEYFVYVSNEEIRFNNINGQVNVRIYDMLGRPVAEYDVYESATISTSSFEAGMYILQMTDENGVRTQKVLVD